MSAREAEFVEAIFADVVPARGEPPRTAPMLRLQDFGFEVAMLRARLDAVSDLTRALRELVDILGRRVAALEVAQRKRNARAARR